ncbi:D-aminoacyl-tRNA deacylase 1 isoform X1 [Hypanus sabinus]|uniref:D-aminoacyl-tRNA deacylase 1 isoform X1 n=1 Tax=Hypanus sabinus TaxID=79690 RepID=UPI0028C4F426|nr:D-aminoacyl-tRNA deacylase 1 isoform X1 [Hypanus sabinus]
MKAIIQRVAKASVTVGEEQISSIGRGLCVLLGISVEDTQKDIEYMVRKILNLRLFEDENGKHWCKSVMDKQYEILFVSQFTLQCILKGNKPDFHLAMGAEQSEAFYSGFLQHARKAYRPELIKDGKFGAYMQVHIQNDGPVTIELESPTGPSDPSLQSWKSSNKERRRPGLKCPRNTPRRKVPHAAKMTPVPAVGRTAMFLQKESPNSTLCTL